MRRPISLLVLTAFALPATGGLDRAMLALRAEPARVDLADSAPERRVLNLPSLEFPLRIEPLCPDASTLTSVSINVADARYRYTPEDFGGSASLDTTIVVPAPQIAPVTVAHGCPAGDPTAATGVIIPDVLTAHAALRCADDSGEYVVFEAIGLGVELRCSPPGSTVGLRGLR